MRRTTAIVLYAAIGSLLALDIVALQAVEPNDYPSKWDPRIASLVTIVEDARHLRFDHPVAIEFLTDVEYEQKQTTNEADLTDDEKREVRVFEGQMRALGLISSDTSLLDDLNTVTTGGTLAYYDPSEQQMVIRGTTLTVGLRVTIVHELTHALQDQAFGLDREFDTDGADSFFQALAEGDATRIENVYVDSLDDAEQEEYFDEADSGFEDVQEELGDVAPALLQFFGAPYALGEQVTTLIVEEKGEKGLDALFRNPPNSDEGLLDVFAAVDAERAKKVETPALRRGETEDDSGDFGAVTWYVVLSSFLEPRTALNAVDGWGGDAYLGYRKDGKTCIRIAFVGDTPADTVEMGAALNQWKAPFTENTVAVSATGDRVELDACEPNVVPSPRAGSGESLALPVARLALFNEVLGGGATRALAECVVNHFIAQVPLDLLDAGSEAEQQQLFTIGERIGRGCASGQLT